jgi:ATP-dependent Clp protease ATP-binding subunit ClpB
LDDGRLTDSQGRTVDFKNTVIIMTSNIGSHLITEQMRKMTEGNKDEVMSKLRMTLMAELRKQIRPEFLNRVDEIVMFQPISETDIRKIVDIQLRRVIEMTEKNGIHLEVTNDARDWLAQSGYDPVYGARPLKRVIQKAIVDPLSMKILAGEISQGDTVQVDHNERGQYTFDRIATESAV